MRRPSGAIVIGLALLTHLPASLALGFGRIANATVLGQTLDFSVVLSTDGNELLRPECVKADVMAGDNQVPPALVRTRVDTPADGGLSTLRIATSARIDEPVVSVNVALGCPARLSRRFVLFIDPPVLAAAARLPASAAGADAASERSAQASPVTSPSAEARALDSQPAAVSVATPATVAASAEAREARRRARAAAAARRASEPSRVARRSSPAVEPPRVVDSGSRLTVTPVAMSPRAGPRLKLEAELPAYRVSAAASEALVGGAAGAAPSTALAADAAASAPAVDAGRMLALEASIQKLLSEAKRTRESMAALQARLDQAESARYANPLVYGLLALAVLLLGLLLWQRSRRQRDAWWVPGQEPVAASATAPSATAAAVADDEPSLAVPAVVAAAGAAGAAAASRDAVAAQPVQRFVVDPAPDDEAADDSAFGALSTAPSRDMSVEELIDMEQQADFFVVLGQDEAAIDLLMSHVRQGGSASPLAFLKLLEIHRRRDDREPYDRLRERFNRRFNAYAPDWDAAADAGQTLDSYPQVTAQLQLVWADPARAMSLLESLLFRRDANAGTVDLPAYAELLFLYSLARDVAEHDVPTDRVDLLLPIGEESALSVVHDGTQPMPLDVEMPPLPTASPAEAEESAATIKFDFDLEPAPPMSPR